MKHNVYFDEEHQAAVLELHGDYTPAEVHETFDALAGIFASKSFFHLIIDLRHTRSIPDAKTRKALEERGRREKGEFRMCFVVTNPAARMAAKVVSAMMGKRTGTRFFKSRGEALSWLRGNNEV